MKSLTQYIFEAIKRLPEKVRGIIVFDIDDTLLKANPSIIKIYKKDPSTNTETELTTDEFAQDPDSADPNKRSWFSFRDFQDPVKVYSSIMTGTPIVNNLRIMDDYINAGYDFCFLTARGAEDAVKKALKDFLRVKNKNTGALVKLEDTFKETLSHAVNDLDKFYIGRTDAEKKANVLRNLCRRYDRVIFVDDDTKNVKTARELGLGNLKVIKAHRI